MYVDQILYVAHCRLDISLYDLLLVDESLRTIDRAIMYLLVNTIFYAPPGSNLHIFKIAIKLKVIDLSDFMFCIVHRKQY